MVLVWSPACSMYRSFSRATRYVITTIPAEAYLKDARGINVTLQAATRVITEALQRLSLGVPVRDLLSMGGGVAPLLALNCAWTSFC